MARPDQSADVEPQRRKSTLTCSTCGHESPAQDDWVVRERADGPGRPRRIIECPVCETVIQSRPIFRRITA